MEVLPMLFIPALVLLPPVFIIALVLRYRRTRAELRYQFLLKLAETGIAPPAVLPGEVNPLPCDRRRGLILLAGGLGLSVTLLALPLHYQVGHRVAELWGLGILPCTLGLGYLSNWWLVQRSRAHG